MLLRKDIFSAIVLGLKDFSAAAVIVIKDLHLIELLWIEKSSNEELKITEPTNLFPKL